MPTPLIVVTGTGTEIGKTHFSVSLTLFAGKTQKFIAIKPIESGSQKAELSDSARLAAVSTLHVKHPLPCCYSFREPISPSQASRQENLPIDLNLIVQEIESIRKQADGVLVELPGGLFSPLTDKQLNVDLCVQLNPTRTLLIVPDQLGAIHDTIAVERASYRSGIALSGFIMNHPKDADRSTGTNADEIQRHCSIPYLGSVPRAQPHEIAKGLSELWRAIH
ncbi:dethiobiotin synthase [Pajaroellobacter abortibovis]|uniref:ATP-dependent dethiobiotin synthetase BioD n=1 Tax=Pajaroellobacter abortibovis TaxID=1882918 RepID=A0A1L6MUN0_9BACT|nr:dethiobiotin synthase [Pajaroellobacter abortibovis]APR99238.1 dethiobiotin synthase [Pajaroellobacter abortibovis]